MSTDAPPRASRSGLYAPHPELLVHPMPLSGDERVLVAETGSATAPLILRDARVAHAITLLPDRGTREEITARWSAEETLRPLAEELWQALTAEGVLVAAEDVPSRAATWRSYGWDEAYRYHASTTDYPFLQMDREGAFDADDARMEEYMAAAPPPPITMDVAADGDGAVPLRKIAEGESADALLAALTPEQRRGPEGLALLLDTCFGERTRRPFAVQGDFLRKAVPSGGARHPTEAFVALFPGSGVTPGIYHYNVAHHRLDLVRAGDHSAALRTASFDLFDKFHQEPFGLIVFCSLVERAMWRYRDARSARAPFIDVGHTLMAYRTVIERLGVGGYTYQKFHDQQIAALLGIDVTRLAPLFLGTLV
ncbi:SagB/ThcOx family dehydrogenase [Streptomyces antimicrobicus]|uniref:SagB/ThcOx family dehydrogenase n=1 Tax=Streptomyces antimicrobicus TaxID=2883108 RepID=A0ABS8B330_9ACTN|nr:SagB/ThcOx family dehydrogenase [Streptomyces antimicrobicus]MCB5179010.1 SagB/ThcOx family dehydrogenase [Streptomyces antimicrobicus]